MTGLDFMYAPQLQSLLFILSIISASVHNRTSIRLVQTFYGDVLESKKKLNYLIIVCVVLYVGSIYGAYALNGFQTFELWMESILLIPNPLLFIAAYGIMNKFFRFPGYKLAIILRHAYLYSLAIATISTILSRIFIPKARDQNYMAQAVAILVLIALCLLLYQIISRLIKHYKPQIQLPSSLYIDKKILLTHSILESVLVYILTTYMLQAFYKSIFGHLLVLLCLILALACDIILTCKSALSSELREKDLTIGNLMRTVDDYSQLKHNFETILKTYDTHLENGDLEAITRYHESLMGKTISTVQSINMAQKMAQNPALVSLLLKKTDYAYHMNVNFLIPRLCSLEDMNMEDLDLGRLLSNLLNNAIEAAAVSAPHKVIFSILQKQANCKLITISNSISEDIDIDTITRPGMTTKENHMGVGLTQVQNIISRYDNCHLNISCRNKEFYVYLELRKP